MRYSLLFLPLAILFATGCAGTNVIQDPVARVVGVRLIEQTDQGARVEVTVDLQNPNAIPLPLVRSDYTVSVPGVGTYDSTDVPQRTLPASAQQEVTLPAVFATKEKLNNATYTVSGSIAYEPPGEIRKLFTNAGVPLPTAIFSATGRLE